MMEYTREDAIFEIENELAIEQGIPTEADLEVFASEALEAGNFEEVFDFTTEAAKKKMSKEECMKQAKKKALEKFKKTSKYKKATKGLSNAEKAELDRKLNREMNRREREADSVWVKHPYAMTFLCLFFLGIIGAFISVYYLDKHSAARARYNS